MTGKPRRPRSATRHPDLLPEADRHRHEYCSGNGGIPSRLAPTGSYPRAYQLHDRRESPTPLPDDACDNPVLGEYYGVQGTTWQDPPILQPDRDETVNGKRLLLYANGGTEPGGWRTPQGVYWISNTLTDSIGNRQMVGIAASLTRRSGR